MDEAVQAARRVGAGRDGDELRGVCRLACAGALALAAGLAGCAVRQPAGPVAAPAAAQASAPAAVSKDAPESYTAQTAYGKLVRAFPFIRVASGEVPATVRALRDITYIRHGARELQLDLYLPAEPAPGPLPGIVLVHGGGWRVGLRENLAPLAIRLAEHGYAAATISYRLSGEAQYPAAVLDAKAAVRWMRGNAARYGIDPARIAIGGASAGGQIASLAGVSQGVAGLESEPLADGAGPAAVSSAVQAIVNIDGLSDFTAEAARKYEDDPAKQPSSAGAWLGGRYAEKTARWHAASPLFYVNAHTPPVLFIDSAQPRFSVGRDAMVGKMAAFGIPTQVVALPDTPHSFWLFDPWLAPTVRATVAFLDRALRARPVR